MLPAWVPALIFLVATVLIGRTAYCTKGHRRAMYFTQALCTLYLCFIYGLLAFGHLVSSDSTASLVRVGVSILGMLLIANHIDTRGNNGC